MAKKLSKLQSKQQEAEAAVAEINQKINELGFHASNLYFSLTEIHVLFNRIRNLPEENILKYKELKEIRVNWKQQAEKIELEYKNAVLKAAGQGAAGIGAGVAVVTLGPTAAMGIATTFGVASTGTAISALSGAAATNAALAWLGGGAIISGGGGMAAGRALLKLAGPVGWAVAGLSIVASGFLLLKTKCDREKLENIYTLISERDVRSYELAIVELNERINRIIDENEKLENAITRIETFGSNYSQMSEEQQYELGAYVNLMEVATMLLVNPILGLQLKFTEEDFERVCVVETESLQDYFKSHKNMVISMANLLFKIDLNDSDRELLAKSLRKNKEFLESIQMTKNEFGVADIVKIERALAHRYKFRAY